jgi:hypothetical protein
MLKSLFKRQKPDWKIKYELKKQFFIRAFKLIHYNEIDGDYVEFGCHGAMTFRLAYDQIALRNLPIKMWAFDSFEGLPNQQEKEDYHPRWIEGSMNISLSQFRNTCTKHGIPEDQYETVQGYYEQSLQEPSENKLPNNICLAYIDCDLYSSTKTVLDFLSPRLKHGMLIAFDDYYWFSSTQLSGERRAMLEFFKNNPKWNLEPYMQYSFAGKCFIVEDKTLLEVAESKYEK